MNPNNHIFCCRKWLQKAKFENIEVKSFVGDIVGPLSENDKAALTIVFRMLWGNSENEVSKDDWERFNEHCLSSSDKFILNDPGYYGSYVYTLKIYNEESKKKMVKLRYLNVFSAVVLFAIIHTLLSGKKINPAIKKCHDCFAVAGKYPVESAAHIV